MDDPADVDPIPGPEAFGLRDREAQLSQAAFLLATGAAVSGEADQVPRATPLDLPPLGMLLSPQRLSLPRALRGVDLSVTEHLEHPDLQIPSEACTHLAREVVDHPTPDAAAALIEASLHSPHPLVRTAAAVAALDTTGPRPDLIARLAEGARSRDELTRALGRTGLGRAAPAHEALRHLVGQPAPLTGRDQRSHTAVVTHGTFASRTTWWQPDGRFPTWLDTLEPPLHVHDQSFRWSGLYLDIARQQAADEMILWMTDQELDTPDLFAHSHGGTVGNLATQRGLELDRLVLLSWPVHGVWNPAWQRVRRVIDIRVRFDLVIVADRGGQRIRPPASHRDRVSSHVHGWFDHSATHDPAYWEHHGLAEVLPG
jgi:hypothetical protein